MLSDLGGARSPARTWIFAAIGAGALHVGAVALALVAMQPIDQPDELGTNAIEVGYVRLSPRTPVTDLPAGPNSEASVASPAVQEQQEVVKDADLPQATPTDVEDPDRIVTPDKEKKSVEEKTETPKAPAPASAAAVAAEATAAPSSEASIASIRSVASERGTGDSARRVRTTWQKELIAHLDRYRRYPADRSKRQADIMVMFTLDRTGHVLSASVARSSGDRSFDDAALGMIRRADPVPAPPPVVADDGLTFTLPVEFRPKDRR
ncbi:MAG TPA: TonB family protein [Xanthobacteraceae bacterium]